MAIINPIIDTNAPFVSLLFNSYLRSKTISADPFPSNVTGRPVFNFPFYLFNSVRCLLMISRFYLRDSLEELILSVLFSSLVFYFSNLSKT